MKVGKRLAGKTVKCPSCSAEIRVPFQDEEDQFDISLLMSAARQEHEDRDEVVEMDESDYEEIQEDVLIGRGVFKITRTRLILFVALYLVIMISVLAGGIIIKRISEKEEGPANVPAVAPAIEAIPPGLAEGGLTVSVAKIRTIAWDTFASGGYRPAAPGKLYAKVALSIQGGAEAFSVPNAGKAIHLELDDTVYPSLGEPLKDPMIPVRARRRVLEIAPDATEVVTLLFEVPAEPMTGRLYVQGLPSQVIALPAPSVARTGFDGTWRERSPRNLKPLLTEPVMARLQQTPEQHIVITQSRGQWRLAIPDADVRGVLEPQTDGTAKASLSYGSDRLDATLRLTRDGERLVLYLDEAPLHQMTYQRESADDAEPTQDQAKLQ
jgi:hypothetical protein